jgi:monoamine oxidase
VVAVSLDLYDATWVERHHRGRRAAGGGAVATAYLAPVSYTDRSLIALSDEALVARGTAEVEKVFPGAAARVIGHDVQRFPHAYPVMTPGAFGRLAALHRTLSGPLQLAGDGLSYPTFEAAVEMGALAAERVEKALD